MDERDGGMETGSVDGSETRSVMMKKDKITKTVSMGASPQTIINHITGCSIYVCEPDTEQL